MCDNGKDQTSLPMAFWLERRSENTKNKTKKNPPSLRRAAKDRGYWAYEMPPEFYSDTELHNRIWSRFINISGSHNWFDINHESGPHELGKTHEVTQ